MAHRRGSILYVCGTPLVPPKVGPARRNFHVLEQLARFFDVTVVAFGEPDHAGALRAALRQPLRHAVFLPRCPWKYARKLWHTAHGRCDYLAPYDAGLQATVTRLAAESGCDAIVLSTVLLGRLLLPRGVKVVADTHNVEFDLQRRMSTYADGVMRRAYARRQADCTRLEERRTGRAADLVFATSAHDRRLLEHELGLDNVVVLPNGIDLSEFRPIGGFARSPVIVFSGLMSWYPNEQGVRWFLDRVFPDVVHRVPAVRFVVAGAAPPRWLRVRRDAHLVVTGAVRDMRPFLAEARAVVAPLKIGGGTRVKILEAQAMGKPVVSTTVGAEGLEQTDEASILIADDADAFAAQVVRLLTDDLASARIGEGGRRHALTHFNWDDIGGRLAQTLETRLGLVPGRDDGALTRATC